MWVSRFLSDASSVVWIVHCGVGRGFEGGRDWLAARGRFSRADLAIGCVIASWASLKRSSVHPPTLLLKTLKRCREITAAAGQQGSLSTRRWLCLTVRRLTTRRTCGRTEHLNTKFEFIRSSPPLCIWGALHGACILINLLCVVNVKPFVA